MFLFFRYMTEHKVFADVAKIGSPRRQKSRRTMLCAFSDIDVETAVH